MEEKKTGKRQRSRVFRFTAVAVIVMLLAGAAGILWNSGKSTMHLQEPDSRVDIKKEMGKEPSGDKTDERSDLNHKKEESGKYQTECLQNVKYPGERELMQGKNREPDSAFLKNLKPFYQQTMRYTLMNDKKENMAYSPINLYLCMAMLSEMTDGQTKQQLLDALGQESLADVRRQSQRMWNSIYSGSNLSKCILADSIWLREDIPYDKDVLKVLADYYYASAHQGEMGTESMDRAIQEWINSMTGNRLKKQAERLETHEDTVLMLLSTADFYDQWADAGKFPEENTKKDVFYNADGKKVTCDFMNQVMHSHVYQEKRFSSVSLGLESGKTMNIFLPEEGVDIEDMLENDMQKILHISSDMDGEGAEFGEVTLSLPKFEITTEKLDFIPVMKSMGIEDLFDSVKGNFRKLLGEGDNQPPVYVDKVEQATKVAVDENGCSVASYTVVEMREGAAMVNHKKYTINCNRPFLFVINNEYDRIPIFAGVVYQM